MGKPAILHESSEPGSRWTRRRDIVVGCLLALVLSLGAYLALTSQWGAQEDDDLDESLEFERDS